VTDFAYERLSQLDNSFLVYEGPTSPMHVACTQIYEAAPLRGPGGALDIDRLRDYVESRLHLIPRYRQRLAYVPLENHPVWVDDGRFNLLYHVRHTRLPKPGDERALKRLAGRILSQALDRGKPLWELWVIEGLERDRFALLTKTHHCMIDGISGVDLLSVLMTDRPTDAIEPPPAWSPRPAPTAGQLVTSELLRSARTPFDLARAALRIARDEDHARHELAERALALGRLVEAGFANASNTPLNQPIGPHRRVDWLPMDLGAIREVKERLGGSVNDVVLAITAGAVRRFLQENRATDVRGLDFRVMAPVSMRSQEQRGTLGNRVAAWIVPLPIGEPDPKRRLELVRETTERLKRTKQALGAETLTQVTEWTGPTLLALGARLMTWGTPFNLVVTNVPGPRAPLFLLGARMLEAHPMVPLLGNLSLGIALFSYCGTLSWGLSADWDLVPDLHDFVRAIERSFRELRRAAGVETQTRAA
jgi:WS/DGAT/MGAT family acyltransferase